jgi:penicillin-binding protein 1C
VGVETAAMEYFGTTPESLTAGQAALLAAVFNDPEAFHPWCRPTAARTERNRILDRMFANGAISEAAHARGISEPLGVTTERGC